MRTAAAAPATYGAGGAVVVAVLLALGVGEPYVGAAGVAAGAVPGLVHGLRAVGGLRGLARLAWYGR